MKVSKLIATLTAYNMPDAEVGLDVADTNPLRPREELSADVQKVSHVADCRRVVTTNIDGEEKVWLEGEY